MAQKRNNRRRRRGRGSFGPLLRLLSVMLTAVVIVVALTLFFKVDRLIVKGNSRYSAEEIIAASGVEQGDNLILLDKYQIARELYTRLPYITDVRVNRVLPDGLRLEVTETTAVLAVEGNGAWWLVSAGGKIVEATDAPGAQGYLVFAGAMARDAAVCENLMLAEDSPLSAARLQELIDLLNDHGMLERVGQIDVSDPDKLVISYDARFDVEIGYDADFAFKLDCLKAVVDELEPNETGIIRMTMEDENEVRFIPRSQK